jgi:hypothetical protein
MRRLSIVAWMAAVLLAACGGGSQTISTGPPSKGGPPPPPPTGGATSIAVTANTKQISADGSVNATITAAVKDANNNFVTGATVTFAATAGALTVTQGTTNASGQAIATLTGGGVASGTAITVTASSGSTKGTVVINVANIQQSLTLTTSLPQIPSDGSKAATITALVRDATNKVIPGVAVNFAATSGGLVVTQGTTDSNGTALATLSAAGDPSNRTITVSANVGTSSGSIPVNVTGTTLTVKGSPTLVLNGTGTYTVSLTNSSNAGIPNTPVTLTSALGNTLSSATVTTDPTGQKSFTVTASKSGSDTIAAASLGISATQVISVSAQNFSFTTPPSSSAVTNVNLTSVATPVSQQLTVVWTINGVPQMNKTVTFAATRGTLSSATATTDSTGSATVTISSTIAGPATVTASATGVTTQTSLDFIATNPASIDLQASPGTIATHAQSTLTAVVRDASNNLVEGQTVTFQTVGDITGGTLSVASAITDVQGRAQTVYTSSSTPSASNGVKVQATVQGTTVTPATANLTVGGLAVGLSLGTGNQLTELPTGCTLCTQFEVPYVVIALDAAGNPVQNVPITLTIHALDYAKGHWNTTKAPYTQVITAACINEDDSQDPRTAGFANFNGVLDPGEDGCTNGVTPTGVTVTPPYTCNPTGNQNGKLDPGATAVASPGSVTTGPDGSAAFNVIYPEDIATWVNVQLIATASVSGTETTASVTFTLPIAAKYLQGPADPPGQPSPYGSANSCTNPN